MNDVEKNFDTHTNTEFLSFSAEKFSMLLKFQILPYFH